MELRLALDAASLRGSDWVERAQRIIRNFDTGAQFTAEHLREIAGDPPGHADVVGAVIRGASKQGLITCTGFTTATRPDAHGRALRTWRRL